MKTFMTKCILGEAKPDQIDDYIEEWHNTPTELSLPDYLGITFDEYDLWIQNSKYIYDIVDDYKRGI